MNNPTCSHRQDRSKSPESPGSYLGYFGKTQIRCTAIKFSLKELVVILSQNRPFGECPRGPKCATKDSIHGARRTAGGRPHKQVIRNIGLLLSGDIDKPVLDADAVEARQRMKSLRDRPR